MDLSKAFDCLPHNLLMLKLEAYGLSENSLKLLNSYLENRGQRIKIGNNYSEWDTLIKGVPQGSILKLEAYGLSENSLKLLNSYLENRRQRIKIGNNYSEWDTLIKGVPQGSILGPVLFNVFINDIFHFVQDSTIYNYADDNTLFYSDTNLNTVVKTLENDSINLIDWFSKNLMKANPDKFQAIAIGPKTNKHNLSFDLKGNKITCEENVKLLGITVDSHLNFDKHISEICKKASQQLNILKRIGKYLNRLGRLTIYYSFILSNFNYCPVTWHFCSEKNTKKIEKIQERALRFIYEHYENTYENLLKKSKLPSLKIRRLRTIAVETFKIIHKQSPSYLHDLISIKDQKYNFRHQDKAVLPGVRPIIRQSDSPIVRQMLYFFES